jgi:DNA-binding NtrC family response regulator
VTQATVLVIDDEEAVREAVAADLKREGYRLVFAENGDQGLERLEDSAPTVIILDLRMPVMDGFEFLKAINLRPESPFLVVVLTGHGDADAIKVCYDAGVSTFIKKPFNLYEIRGVVKNAVAVKQLTNQLDQLVKERTLELEQRVREVTALNQMYQDQIAERTASGQDGGPGQPELVAGLENLAQQTNALLRLARSQPEANG